MVVRAGKGVLMDQLRINLIARLRTLADRIERGELRDWQIERFAAALAPEMALAARIDGGMNTLSGDYVITLCFGIYKISAINGDQNRYLGEASTIEGAACTVLVDLLPGCRLPLDNGRALVSRFVRDFLVSKKGRRLSAITVRASAIEAWLRTDCQRSHELDEAMAYARRLLPEQRR
jgi:hypothetical protein